MIYAVVSVLALLWLAGMVFVVWASSPKTFEDAD